MQLANCVQGGGDRGKAQRLRLCACVVYLKLMAWLAVFVVQECTNTQCIVSDTETIVHVLYLLDHTQIIVYKN